MKILRKIYEAGVVKRNPPCNIIPADEKLFGGPQYECRLEESNLFLLRNVTVTHDGIILKHLIPFKRFIVYYQNDFRKYWQRYVLHVLLKMKRQEVPEKKYLLIFDNYTSPAGLAHWVSDCLTRLAEMNDELAHYTVLLPDYFHTSPLMRVTLDAFNICNIQEIKKGHFIKTANLYVCDHLAPSGDYRPENIEKLRKILFHKFQLPAERSGEKIYISRKKANRRFVLNEIEVEQHMINSGFRVVCMEDLSFENQIQLANSSSLIVSIHGAALSHILFMRKGSSVLELRKDDDGENCMFFSLADAIGINYYYLACNGIFNNNTANNFDIEVDIQKLDSVLRVIQKHEKDRY